MNRTGAEAQGALPSFGGRLRRQRMLLQLLLGMRKLLVAVLVVVLLRALITRGRGVKELEQHLATHSLEDGAERSAGVEGERTTTSTLFRQCILLFHVLLEVIPW